MCHVWLLQTADLVRVGSQQSKQTHTGREVVYYKMRAPSAALCPYYPRFISLFYLLFFIHKILFHFSFKARGKVTEVINNAIVHYRNDIDLQNLIDFGQEEVRI